MNEQFQVLSIHSVNFKKPDTGDLVEGVQLFLGNDKTTNPTWFGYEVVKVWIAKSSPLYDNVMLLRHGDLIDVRWNRYGKLDSFSIV